jgi:hypothetical protein
MATPGLTNCSPLPVASKHRRLPAHDGVFCQPAGSAQLQAPGELDAQAGGAGQPAGNSSDDIAVMTRPVVQQAGFERIPPPIASSDEAIRLQ